MNYRHAFHAGNFADCVKHALLVWLVRALQRKAAPMFALDTHAGVGWYELDAGPAARTGEWRAGIGRLLDNPPPALAEFVALTSLAAKSAAGYASSSNASGYPGSPVLVRTLLRPDDRLVCCELHPEDHEALRRRFIGDCQVAVHHRDAWEALGALLPPREKRGLVLIDPPFEQPQEYDRLVRGLTTGWQRFRTGVFAAWYPIKHRAPARQFLAQIQQAGIRDVMTAELCLREPADPARLNGCGLVVVNSPYRFEQEAPPILHVLLDRLGNGEAGAAATVRRIADE